MSKAEQQLLICCRCNLFDIRNFAYARFVKLLYCLRYFFFVLHVILFLNVVLLTQLADSNLKKSFFEFMQLFITET